jgi:hypothetical protein
MAYCITSLAQQERAVDALIAHIAHIARNRDASEVVAQARAGRSRYRTTPLPPAR